MQKKTVAKIESMPKPSGVSVYHESPIFSHLELIKAVTLSNKTPCLFHRGGGVSKVFRLNGLNYQAMSDSQFKALYDSLELALNSLPSSNVHITITVVKKPATFDDGSQFKAPYYLRARRAFFSKLCSERKVFKYEFYLTIFSPGEDRANIQKVFGYISSKINKGKNLFERNSSAEFFGVDERLALLSETEANLLPTLSTLGLHCEEVRTEDEYYDLIQDFTRPTLSEKVGKVKVNAKIESPRRALFSGVVANPFYDYFLMDDVYHKVFTMDKAPQEDISPTDIMKILSISQEMILSVTIQKLDKEQQKKRIENALWNRRMELTKNKGEEDYFANAEYNRIINEIQRLAEGQTFGAAVSLNLALRIPKSHIESQALELNCSQRDYVRRITSKIKTAGFNGFGRSDWSEEREGSVPTYFRMIPGMAHLSSYHMKSVFLAGSDVPFYLPIYDTSSAEGFNGMNGWIDDNDSLYAFDPLDKKLNAWNYYVIGQTGSGKSFILNSIIANEYGSYYLNLNDNPQAKKPVLCIMDEGGGDANSFAKQVEILGGQYISLGGAKKPYIQLMNIRSDHARPTPKKMAELVESILPHVQSDRQEAEQMLLKYFETAADKDFSTYPKHLYEIEFEKIFNIPVWEGSDELLTLHPGECEPNSEQMRKIVSTLEIMLSPSNEHLNTFSQGLFREDQIRRLVREAYHVTEGRFPYISDVVELAKSKGSELHLEFVDRMSSWCRDGDFPNFDLDSDVDLTNDLILVDFKGIGKEAKLKAIYTLMFTGLFEDKMMRQKDQRRFFFVDEAWSMLANNEARKVYIEFLRTARKHKFCTMSSTQTIVEYLNADEAMGRAALGQMQMGIIGYHKPELVSTTCDILQFDEKIAKLLPKLGPVKDAGGFRYSRFLIHTPNSTYLLRNEVDPNEYWVYTSDGDENFVIDYFNRRGDFIDKEEVCRFMAAGKANGDEGLIQHLRNSGKLDMVKRYSAARHGLPV